MNDGKDPRSEAATPVESTGYKYPPAPRTAEALMPQAIGRQVMADLNNDLRTAEANPVVTTTCELCGTTEELLSRAEGCVRCFDVYACKARRRERDQSCMTPSRSYAGPSVPSPSSPSSGSGTESAPNACVTCGEPTRCPREHYSWHQQQAQRDAASPTPCVDYAQAEADARVGVVDEVCKWLAARGDKATADALWQSRMAFYLATHLGAGPSSCTDHISGGTVRAFVDLLRAELVEQCARVCESIGASAIDAPTQFVTAECAAAIRALPFTRATQGDK